MGYSTANPPAPPVALSIVVPFFQKLTELGVVLPYNARYLSRPDVELVLVLDEPSQEAEVLALLDAFPLLRVRVVVNDRPHAWRPPCVAINVGIRNALGEFVLVTSPESVFVGDAPSRVIEVLRDHPLDVLLGRVGFATFAEAHGRTSETLFPAVMAIRAGHYFAMDYYGSVAAARATFQAVHGYDESLSAWGGDDDNLRARLSMQGALLMLDRELNLIHLSEDPREPRYSSLPADELRSLVNPTRAQANSEPWGAEFSRIARDWSAEPAPAPARVLERSITTGVTPGARRGAPFILAAFSFRYDAHLVEGLIANISPFVDGWIAFDDRDSEAVFSDEVERRRILVRTAHAMGARWLLAVDPDERFEDGLAGRIAEMTSIGDPACWSFNFRELYAPDRYRVDGLWGRKTQSRLFPLRADLRLGTKALHAPWCAYRPLDSQLNLYHLKMITPARRKARSALYNALDPDRRFQREGYDYLADDQGAVFEPIPPGRGYSPAHQDDGGLWMPEPPAMV